MKKLFNLFYAIALIGASCVAFVACDGEPGQTRTPEKPEQSDELTDDIYYVAGYDAELYYWQDDGTVKSGAYLFISANLQDTVCVYNRVGDNGAGKLLDGIYEFSEEVMRPVKICGFWLFPEEYRYSYPVKIDSHRPLKKDEHFSYICDGDHFASYIHPNKYIVVESLSKVE